MEPFILDLEDEVVYYLEGNNNNYEEFKDRLQEIIRSRYFSFFSSLYGNLSLNDFFKEDFETSPFIYPSLVNSKITEYEINIANPLKIKLKKRDLSKNPSLESILLNSNYELNREIDLEFFECYSEQELFFRNYLNKEIVPKNIKNPNIIKLLENIKKNDIKTFEEDLELFSKGKFENLIEVIDENKKKIKSDIFTSFLDTEKIHLKFAEITNKRTRQKKIILTYFGYGNYYPFTKNIKSKKAYENRFLRYSYDSDLDTFKKYLENSENYNINKILELLNRGHLEFENYFNNNLSYSLRLNQTPARAVTKEFDKLLILNPKIRTRASAFIAYSLFKNEEFEFLKQKS